MYHKVIMLGNISEPEIRKNQKGTTFLKFGLAVQESKNAETYWHNCILSGALADAMSPHLAKGMTLYVEGRPSQRKADDGRVFHDVFVDILRIASRKAEPESF